MGNRVILKNLNPRKFSYLSGLSWLPLVSAIVLGTLAKAQNSLPSSETTLFGIESVEYQGTGCRPGTVAHNVSTDAQTFSLIFSDYMIDTSVRSGRPMRKACSINLRLRSPRKWSFAIYGVQLRGYAALEEGVVGVAKTIVFFNPGGSGGPGRVRGAPLSQEVGRHRIIGPFDDNFEQFTDIPVSQADWSPCGPERTRKLHLKTAIVVRPQKGYADSDGDVDQPASGGGFPRGTISVDSVDGGIAHKFSIAWKKCPA